VSPVRRAAPRFAPKGKGRGGRSLPAQEWRLVADDRGSSVDCNRRPRSSRLRGRVRVRARVTSASRQRAGSISGIARGRCASQTRGERKERRDRVITIIVASRVRSILSSMTRPLLSGLHLGGLESNERKESERAVSFVKRTNGGIASSIRTSSRLPSVNSLKGKRSPVKVKPVRSDRR